jgi:hypothetical protein
VGGADCATRYLDLFTSNIKNRRKKKMIFNADEINAEYKKMFYDQPDRRDFWAEVMRAKFVIMANEQENPARALLNYNVQNQVIEYLLGELPAPPEPKKKRSDKYEELIEWCKDNHLVQVNAEQIAEQGDMSYSTALKFIKDRPDLFYKIKKGVYEVRNPEIVRQEENIQQR